IIADPQPRVYRKVLLKNGVPVGMLTLGDRKGALALKRAIDHGINLIPVASQLFIDDFNFTAWLDKQGVPPPILSVNREGAVAVAGAALAVGPSGTKIESAASKPQPVMEAFLVPAGEGSQAELPLSQTRVMTIGRQAGVFLLIDQASVSRRHAEIS